MPGTITVLPIRLAESIARLAAVCESSAVRVSFIVCRPLTVLICASCEVSWALSIGLSGSWLFSCVTSIFRKLF
ncbi:hypothetical protein D3C86_2155960 [compost metagenome]